MKQKTNILRNLWWVCKAIFKFDKKYIFILTSSTIFLGILPPISILISQEIINGVQKKESLNIVLNFIIFYILLDLFSSLFNQVINYYKSKFLLNFSVNFDNMILEKTSKLNMKSFENSDTYNILNRAQYEANGRLITYFETFLNILSYFITMLSCLMILLTFNIFIVGIVIIIPIIKFVISRKINVESFLLIKARTNDSRKCWYIQYMMTHEEFYKEIKTYNLSNYFIDKYKKLREEFNKQDIKLSKKQAVCLCIISIFEGIVDGLLFIYVILCGFKGVILIGNVLTYMKIVTQIKEQMTNVLSTFSGINKESLFIDELMNFFNLKEEESIGTKKIDHINNIKIEHLFYRYNENQEYVLKDINLEIKFGETVVIVGKNGSGKTTLIKILMGFYDDYEGEIFVNDINLRNIDKKFFLKNIGTLFQDFVKYEATFRENIAYGNLEDLYNDTKLFGIAKKFGLEQLIQNSNRKLECQLGYWFDSGKQISIGQWQKVALARAFTKDADIYILDEPNAALDAISEYELSVLYNDILEQKIGIIIAHKFNNFIKEADKVVVLHSGELVGIGTHDYLMQTNNIYKDMYEIQQGIKKLKKQR